MMKSRTLPGRPTKLLIQTAIASTAMLVLAACGSDTSAGEGDVAGLKKAGVFSICGISDYPPMNYLDENGELTGSDIEIMNAVADHWGVRLDHNVMAFDGLIPALDAGRCDAAWASMTYTEERAEAADAVPFMATAIQMLVQHGNPLGIETVEDLAGKTVAVQSGTVNVDYAKQVNEDLKEQGLAPFEIAEYPKTSDAQQQVAIGRAAANFESDFQLAFLVKQYPEEYEMVKIQPANAAQAAYVKKGSPLDDEIHAALEELLDSGELAKIAEKYGFEPDSFFAPITGGAEPME